MPDSFASRWNQRAGFKSVDCDWIGEDDQGIWTRQDPRSVLAAMPELWPEVTAWQHGIRDFTADEYEAKSNFDYEVKMTLAAANSREEQRRMKRPDPEEEETSAFPMTRR
jgi:hypothetical protein